MGKHNKEFYKSALYDVYDNLLKDDIEKAKYIIQGIIVEDECVNRKCSIINSYVTDKYEFPTMVTELNKGEFIKWIYRGIRRVGKVRMEKFMNILLKKLFFVIQIQKSSNGKVRKQKCAG